MHSQVLQRYGLAIITFAILLFTWNIQSQLILNSDVSWLIHAASRLLSGGTYATDFFETNPPLILYLYTPIVALKNILGTNTFNAMFMFISLLSCASLLLCYILLQGIFQRNDQVIPFICMTVLGLIFMLLPLGELGQRENLLVIFTMPYFLLMAARLETHDSIPPWLLMTTGLAAGLGFAIKPYFYLPLLFAEMYLCCTRKQLTAFIRPETVIIALVAIAYIGMIFLFNKDYINVILPLIVHSYYQKFRQPLYSIFFCDQSIFTYFVAAFYLIRIRYSRYTHLNTILLLASAGFWLAFVIQQTNWYYHAIPFFSFNILLASLLFCELATQKEMSKIEYITCALFAMTLLGYLYTKIYDVTQILIYFPYTFFTLFAAIFTLLLYAAHPKDKLSQYKIVASVCLIMYTSILLCNYIDITIWTRYQLPLTLMMLLLTFALMLPAKQTLPKLKYVFLAFLGAALFIYPFHRLAFIYNYTQYYDTLYLHLIDEMKPYKNKSVYYFTITSDLVFPASDYSQQKYASRFWSMAWLPDMPKTQNTNQYKQDMNFYVTTIVNDFLRNEPAVVFVDKRQKGHYFFNVPPDYIKLFSEYEHFRMAWKKYRYVGTMDYPPLYKFDIYEK